VIIYNGRVPGNLLLVRTLTALEKG